MSKPFTLTIVNGNWGRLKPTAEMLRSASLHAQEFPALVYMTSGQLLLVMGRDGDALVVYDTTCPDNRAMVPATDFVPFFSGLTLRAQMPIEKVAEPAGCRRGAVFLAGL